MAYGQLAIQLKERSKAILLDDDFKCLAICTKHQQLLYSYSKRTIYAHTCIHTNKVTHIHTHTYTDTNVP